MRTLYGWGAGNGGGWGWQGKTKRVSEGSLESKTWCSDPVRPRQTREILF